MTDAEYGSFRALRTEPQRRQFIREFWERRDPLPATEENELERTFWERVRIADNNFSQDVKPGWKTERGKVFIVLGPPINYENDHILADIWGARRWVYDLGQIPSSLRGVLQESLGIPEGRRFVSLLVRAEAEGARAVGNAVAVRDSVLRPTQALTLAETLVRRIKDPDVLRQLGALMRVPEVIQRSDTDVEVATVFSPVPLQARVDFRPASQDRTDLTAVAITLGVPPGAQEGPTGKSRRLALSAKLTPLGGGEPVVLSGSFAPDPRPEQSSAGPSPTSVYQAMVYLPAGPYLLEAECQDAGRRMLGALRDAIDVPAFSGEDLLVSSLILSTRIEKIETPLLSLRLPFTQGAYSVVPRTTQRYMNGEDLMIFFEVFGAVPDAQGQRHMDLAYQFYLEDRGAWLPVGSSTLVADQEETAQAWNVTLHGWPSGRYRLEVTVKDTLTGRVSTRGTYFDVAPGGEPGLPPPSLSRS
jgi:GWxTD domain-containing protein